MKCIKCGNEFFEGLFCPECGTRYDENEVKRIDEERQRAIELKRLEELLKQEAAKRKELELQEEARRQEEIKRKEKQQEEIRKQEEIKRKEEELKKREEEIKRKELEQQKEACKQEEIKRKEEELKKREEEIKRTELEHQEKIRIDNDEANKVHKGKPKNKWVALLLCYFTFGGHKIYEGKILLGIIYICTLGFLGVGWIIDLIRILMKPNPYYVE